VPKPPLPPFEPMLATLAAEVDLNDARLAYEPKYDGIRAIAEVPTGGPVRLWSRLGNDKGHQFPEICQALAALTAPRGPRSRRLVLDGEIVALGRDGSPASFEALQPRMHLVRATDIRRLAARAPVAFVAFDVLEDGVDLTGRPLEERRRHLEELLSTPKGSVLRLGRSVVGEGQALWREAALRDWEGIVVKDLASPYRAGRRTAEWRKLKRTHRREFVVGGYTLPRGARVGIGALLLGQYQDDAFVFAGGVGSGLDEALSRALWTRLSAGEVPSCPFATRPRTAEPARWVEPTVVVDVRFASVTDGGLLRHPVLVGIRDDVVPRKVQRDGAGRATTATSSSAGTDLAPDARRGAPRFAHQYASAPPGPELAALIERLRELEARQGAGRVTIHDGVVLEVSNLHKVFWPHARLTKGDLLRYYARISSVLLPVVSDRPLVMQRFPDGVDGEAFYQHRAPQKLPRGVRVAALPDDDVPARLIGGSLTTLLYMAQLGVISQDPWFSRTQTPDVADQIALDLDPMPGVPFEKVRAVALWIAEELERVTVPVFIKTSGATGLHLFVPLAGDTTFETGRLFAQVVGAIVARKHPKVATVERAVQARGATVYIDCLQNIRGKTLACAYSARASAFAGASTPLSWEELRDGARPEDFTIQSVPDRLAQVGDLWAGVRGPVRADLSSALAILERRFAGRV
jgi:bifunctional non-homologous end joining protein LigD